MTRYILIFLIIIIATVNANASREATVRTTRQSILENYQKGIKADSDGNYNEALNHLLIFIKEAESEEGKELFKGSRELSYAYLIVGNLHLAFLDYGAALKYYKVGYDYDLTLEKHDPTLQSYFLNNMTVVCCFLKRFNEAKSYNEAMHRLKGIDLGKQKFSYTLNKGFIAKEQGQWREAIDYMLAAAKYVDQYHLSTKLKVSPYSEIYPIYEEHGQLDSALFYLKKYHKIAEVYHIPNMIVDSSKGLMRIYTKLGDKEKALHYQDIYIELADSLLDTHNFMRIKNDYVEFEDGKTDKKISTLETTASKQKAAIITAIGIILFIITVAIVIYYQKRSLRKAYTELFERNKELVEMENRHQREISSLRQNANRQEAPAKETDTTGDENRQETAAPDTGKAIDNKMLSQLSEKIKEAIENSEECLNPDFSLNTLAKMVGSNTSYVSQAINETYGKNFRSFVNEYRIKEARKRMTDTENYGNYTIQAIAESVGFKSATNFFLAFKKITGITPSIYQKLAKQDKSV